VGIDISIAACRTARGNACALGLERRALFLCGDWSASVAAGFDIILCNPPYIEDAAIGNLAPEVAIFDPRAALAGGADGLAAYRRLAGEIAERLAPGGMAFVEIGQGQADAVSNILSGHVDTVETRTDLVGIQRCLILRHRKKLLDLT
jgi:release factor glutamine methyltransferase